MTLAARQAEPEVVARAERPAERVARAEQPAEREARAEQRAEREARAERPEERVVPAERRAERVVPAERRAVPEARAAAIPATLYAGRAHLPAYGLSATGAVAGLILVSGGSVMPWGVH
jgi:hypothetical protein